MLHNLASWINIVHEQPCTG